ncbi:MAG TPA: 3-oxoacyl-ACP reductase [Chromatiaceae bacterium]|jgi:NAD(P)-dependent dehydrogenase (short-subunit alcohol dehydrogenase family)|nr:MAG: hypothetical protein N838_29435 [Thiohalocapsa sp. PB-PSB1]QQO56001.1 MAG: glucose 1-dehydrogenase [Thiohalocapsa sp. PB-PSB1]HBG93738.1 3-oxoacyl-ACP reductase [Chromatiaceae bacterium]
MQSLTDKVVLITGAGSGIGRATALKMARAGATVVAADIVVDTGEDTVQSIRADGKHATFVRCDVGDSDDVRRLLNIIVDRYGRLDCAFNNAGIAETQYSPGDHGFSEDNWHRIIRTNLTGTWLCLKYEIQQMLQQRAGTIVNMSSIVGLVGEAGETGAYSASKHGIIGLTKTIALTYAKQGIRVNAICPGGAETPKLTQLASDPDTSRLVDAFVAQTPMQRLAQPEEIADAVIWLCSDHATYVTGHTLVVDGGYLAQ